MAKKKRSKKASSIAVHSGTPDALPTTTPDDTQLVPRDVLLRILDLTSQPTVLSVAGVCRSWRSVARAHRFCYAYISLDGDDCETDDQFGCKGVVFAQSIVRAEKLFDRLSIRVVAPTFLDEDGGGAPPDPDNPDTDFLANVLVINTIALHLANVCKMHLALPETCCELFSRLCDHTAPVLEELFIAIDPDDDSHMGPFYGLPDDLFASTAPLFVLYLSFRDLSAQ
ncbi:hypothetical protein AURDEDRAFT_172075 [Auricularia subglabra TFB-10046 SS5]|nr:hypothetical protein AURDEDRAFT_172075 [Auricularia subglabra TFB-10046 SS5]